jgi:hypothetical protein
MVEEYNEAIQYGDQESTLAWNAVRKFTEEKFGYLFFNNGRLRDIEEIKRSCRSLNVITHSLGGVMIQQIGSVIHEMLTNAGMCNVDIDNVTKEVSVFTLGNPAHLRSGKANFTQLHVYGLGDRIAYARCTENHDELFNIVQRKPQLADKNLAIVPIGERQNNFVMCIGNIAITQQQRREGDYKNIPPVIDPNMPRVHFSNGKLEVSVPEHLKGNILEHRADTYLTFGIGTHGIMVPTAIGVALSNAVQNSIRNQDSPEFIELLSVRRLLVAPKVQDISTADNWVNVATKRRGGPDRLQLMQEAQRRAAFDYARSDPNSEKGYAQIERIADGIGYNQRIAEAFGERTQKGTPREAYR